MKIQVVLEAVRFEIYFIELRRVERGGTADHAVHFVPLLEQPLRKVRTILAGYFGDQGAYISETLLFKCLGF